MHQGPFFYDPKNKEKLEKFCKENAISYIPDRNRTSCWKLESNGFILLETLPNEIKCSPSDLIFADTTLQKFKNGNHDEVMFVIENELIKGVVHIIDYNNDELYVEPYRMLLKFENNIRKYLHVLNYSDDDIIECIRVKAETKKNIHYQNRFENLMKPSEVQKRLTSNKFQSWYLKDLLDFSLSKKLFNKDDFKIGDILEIRNWIAHFKDVTAITPNSEHPVYNIEGLTNFIKMTKSFFNSYEILELKIEN